MVNRKKKTRPIPVRLDEVLADRVQDAAAQIGTTSSAIIRLSILTQLTEIESGVIRLPKKGSRS